jgi:hypothetical protein
MLHLKVFFTYIHEELKKRRLFLALFFSSRMHLFEIMPNLFPYYLAIKPRKVLFYNLAKTFIFTGTACFFRKKDLDLDLKLL